MSYQDQQSNKNNELLERMLELVITERASSPEEKYKQLDSVVYHSFRTYGEYNFAMNEIISTAERFFEQDKHHTHWAGFSRNFWVEVRQLFRKTQPDKYYTILLDTAEYFDCNTNPKDPMKVVYVNENFFNELLRQRAKSRQHAEQLLKDMEDDQKLFGYICRLSYLELWQEKKIIDMDFDWRKYQVFPK